MWQNKRVVLSAFCRRYRFSRDARIREDARQQRRKNGYINDIPRACINCMALYRRNAREIVCSARFALKNKALKGSSNTAFAFGGMLFYFADRIIRRLGYDFKRVCGVADGRTGRFRRRGERKAAYIRREGARKTENTNTKTKVNAIKP